MAERLRRADAPAEDSRAIRLAVGLMVEISVLAVVAQGAVGPGTAIGALVLVPVGYAFSYVRRRRPSIVTKLALAGALVVALGAFLRAVEGARSFDDARQPLASLFLWVQVLHSFDVPRRRDLGFSVVSSLMLMAEAGALSFGTGYLVFLVPWLAVAAVYLYLTLSPRPEEVPNVLEVRRGAVNAGRRRFATARALSAWSTLALASISAVFLVMPRLPGVNLALPPFRADDATVVPNFTGQVVNPGLAVGSDGVPEFTDLAYPGFSSTVDLRSRGHLSDEIVMRVRSPQAALWRGLAYDTYDGTRWTVSDDRVFSVVHDFDDSFRPVLEARGLVPTHNVLATFYVQTDLPNVVFGAFQIQRVYFPASHLTADAYGSVRSPILLERGVVYSVMSEIPAPTPDLLRATESVPSDPALEEILAPDLELPASLPARVRQLAAEITSGAPTRYDAVEAVQRWLRANTRYNLDIPQDPPGVDAVDRFLFETREGFCEHIASSMAVLLRAAGIPARLVTGFGPGHRNPFTGYWEVRASDAHAWVEVFYPGVGWIPYDPTFGVPPADPGFSGRFIAPEVLGSIGRFFSAKIPEPVREAARALGRGIASAARKLPVAMVLVALGGSAVVALRRRRARSSRRPPPVGAARAFAELEGAMAARGRPRAEHQTAREFLKGLGPFLATDERADADLIVRLFERDRFSGVVVSEPEEAAALAAAARIAEAPQGSWKRMSAASHTRA
jgi:transglutaminase-like putative cysteine protease